jgi:hypothetical protein
MDLRGNIPVLIHIDHGRTYDTDILDVLVPEPGAIYVMDRGYLDFARLHRLTQATAFFVVRAKGGLGLRRTLSRQVDRTSGLICDQDVRLVFALHNPANAERHHFRENAHRSTTSRCAPAKPRPPSRQAVESIRRPAGHHWVRP